MIITRTPLRASFCGGGSDLPAFYEKHGGCVLSAGINSYVYLTIHPFFFQNRIRCKYSKTELVHFPAELKHPIFRVLLEKFNLSGVEIDSIADVPSGTGLGSSSSFTVGLLHAIYAYTSKYVSRERLAAEACYTEIELLGDPIGKQDQYAAAYGGLNFYRFQPNGSVEVEPVLLDKESMDRMERNLLMFYTGDVRSAGEILSEQQKNIASNHDAEKAQLSICTLCEELYAELKQSKIDALGPILHESWIKKKLLSSGITNPMIEKHYETALAAGATGGKLLGAGGGGFLMFYVPEHRHTSVRNALSKLHYMEFGFDRQGSTVIYVGNKPKSL